MLLYYFSTKVLSRSSRNTVGALVYRAGCKLCDDCIGKNFDYGNKAVEHVEWLLPKHVSEWGVAIQKFIIVYRQKSVQVLWDIVEHAEKRIDAQVWREFEFALHRELFQTRLKSSGSISEADEKDSNLEWDKILSTNMKDLITVIGNFVRQRLDNLIYNNYLFNIIKIM